ncbi:MAG: citrate lyase holo-[acyl-carrier protein] synthase, partial [Eubacteriales bacterium]|nr:citrate lyase holo-[acyl-carrier protein] synthase [Eubacteriales bacterium]
MVGTQSIEEIIPLAAGLTAVLEARDRRAAMRRALLAQVGLCLSVTLLMPGTTNSTSLSRAFLHEYCIYLRGQLLGQGFDITQEEPCPDPAGDAYF